MCLKDKKEIDKNMKKIAEITTGKVSEAGEALSR